MISLAHAFGFCSEPFAKETPVHQLFPLPGLDALQLEYMRHCHAHHLSITGGDPSLLSEKCRPM